MVFEGVMRKEGGRAWRMGRMGRMGRKRMMRATERAIAEMRDTREM